MKKQMNYDLSNETVGYVRVSSREQSLHGFSVSEQIRDILRFAEAHNLILDEKNIVVDSGESGSNLKRHGIQQLLKELPKGNIKRIIIKNNSRVTRAQLDRYALDCVFDRYHIEVMCLEGKWKGESVSEEMQTGVQVFFDEHLRKQVSPDTIRGMKESARQGNFSIGGRPPRGFRRIPNESGKGTHVEPIEEFEKYIVYIFESLKSRQHNKKSLARLFHKHRVMDKNWTDNDIDTIFNNTLVYGVFEKWDLHMEHFCKPIITKELYDEAHKAQETRTCRPKHHYIYSNIVYCKNCQQYCVKECVDKRMKHGDIKVYHYYLCTNCHSRMNEEKLDVEAAFMIDLHALPKEKYELVAEMSEKIEKKKRRLKLNENDYDDGLMSEDDFKEARIRIKKEIVALEEELSKIMQTNTKPFTKLSGWEKSKVAHNKIERIEIDFENNKRCQFVLK